MIGRSWCLTFLLLLLLQSNSVFAQIEIIPAPFINGSGVARGVVLFPDGTNSLPGWAWASQPNTGAFKSGTSQIAFTVNGNQSQTITSDGKLWGTYAIPSNQFIEFSTQGVNGSNDGTLILDSANTYAFRNSINPQTINVYNTRIDASNYELAELIWSANAFNILTKKAGTGTIRELKLGVNDSAQWKIETSNGNLVAVTDNAVDLGDGTHRVRNFYLSGDANLSGNLRFSTDIFAYRSAAKTLKIDTDGAGGALTNVLIQSPLTLAGATNNLLQLPNNSYISFLSTGAAVQQVINFNSSNQLIFDNSNNGSRFGGSLSLVVANTGISIPNGGMQVANVGANSCGTTTATIAGGENANVTTVGATSGTQCRIAFPVAATTEWDCSASDSTTTVAVRTTPVDTTHTDLIGSFTAGDKVTAICFAR